MEIDLLPRWLLARLGVAPRQQRHVALLLSSVLLLAAGPLLAHLPHVCLAQTLLRLPCPGCGVLHALAALRRFDLAGAWQANPAGILLAALLGFQIVARTLALTWTRSAALVSALSRSFSGAVLAGLLLVWVVRLLHGGGYGSRFLPQV